MIERMGEKKEIDRGRGGRVAVAKLYQIAYLEFGLTKETQQTRPAGRLKLQGIYFQAMMDVAGCQYPAERGNYIDFRETTEQTPPPSFVSPTLLNHSSLEAFFLICTPKEETQDYNNINLSSSVP